MYISSRTTCLYVYKLEIRLDLNMQQLSDTTSMLKKTMQTITIKILVIHTCNNIIHNYGFMNFSNDNWNTY